MIRVVLVCVITSTHCPRRVILVSGTTLVLSVPGVLTMGTSVGQARLLDQSLRMVAGVRMGGTRNIVTVSSVTAGIFLNLMSMLSACSRGALVSIKTCSPVGVILDIEEMESSAEIGTTCYLRKHINM